MALLEEDMIHSMVLILVDIILQLGIHLQRLIFIPSNLSKFSDQNCLNSASVFPALSAGRYSFYQAKHERLHKNQEKWELLLLLTSDNKIQSREQCSQVLWFFHWWNNQCAYIILAQCFSNLFLIVSLKEDSMISPDHLLQVLLSTELEKKKILLPWNTGYKLWADGSFLLEHCLTTVSPLSFFLLDCFRTRTLHVVLFSFRQNQYLESLIGLKILLNGNCSGKMKLGGKGDEQIKASKRW